jgi:hypothetical protein
MISVAHSVLRQMLALRLTKLRVAFRAVSLRRGDFAAFFFCRAGSSGKAKRN